MGVAGASRFLNTATLANQQGLAAQQPTVLGDGGIGGVDILDIARGTAPDNGIGLSSRARLLNRQFLDSTANTFNQIFSLGIGASATVEGLQQEILALRAGLSDTQLAPSLRQDTGEVAASENGQQVDTTA